MNNRLTKTGVLWGLFCAVVFLGIFYIFQVATGQVQGSILGMVGVNFIGQSIFWLATALLILHSVWVLGFLPAASFLVVSAAIGFVSEIIGVRFGTLFGGYYAYNPAIHPSVLGVPLVIPIVWAGFIYCGYSLVSCLAWVLKNKSHGSDYRLPSTAIAVFGAFAVVAIDILMEPLQVAAGNWTWLGGGPYFHIPPGNFLGWFLVSFVCINVFLSLQSRKPKTEIRLHPDIRLIPVMGYGLLGLVLTGLALLKGSIWLALIGAVCMCPGVIFNLYLFFRGSRQQSVTTIAPIRQIEVL